MSLENGLVSGRDGSRGTPLVVEISVAFSILIAFGLWHFRVPHSRALDTVDVGT
jgi:hydrogenase-4 component E